MPTVAVLMDALSRAQTFRRVSLICATFLIRRGARRISYHHLPPLGAKDRTSSLTVAAWNFPDDWVEEYQTSNFWKIDPIPRVAISAARPFWWSEVSQLIDLSEPERDYVKALRRARLGDGLAIPVFGPRGRDGYVGIGYDNSKRPLHAPAIARMQLGCQLSHQRYCQILIGDNVPPRLSEREREILHWMARGKSNSVIAEIIGISPHTADTYAKRLYAKLDVHDRINAVLRGEALGLVD